MYVMSSLQPNQQSLAGGIFNTVTKICSAIGLGISASLYNAESSGTAALQTATKPYHSAFWFCVASAALGLCFVPFLTIGTQGQESKASSVTNFVDEKSVNYENGMKPEDLAVQGVRAGEKQH
jgi:hypothetical protein